VLVAQLGSPEAPTSRALRRYLTEFLSDRHVIDYPSWFWQPILQGVILPRRSPRSARLYRSIWMPEGSPLVVHSRRFAAALQQRLGDGFRVALGMRYGQPGLPRALQELADGGVRRLIVAPMFPQYSGSTTGSIQEAVKRWAASSELSGLEPRFVEPFYDSSAYLDALASNLRLHFASLPQPADHCLVSFHGLPRRYLRRGDPYESQCHATGQLLADRMGWLPGQWSIGFQSRFGPEAWLEPSTQTRIRELARQEVKRLVVVAPSFVADCLETLSELGIEGRQDFADAGGDSAGYSVAPCLNDDARWVESFASLVLETDRGPTD
jgi:ferrochelatase